MHQFISNYNFSGESISKIPQKILSPDKVAKVDRNREEGQRRLYNDYFASNSVFKANTFRRRFQMKRELFCRVMDKVTEGDKFFLQKQSSSRLLGFTPMQRCTAAIRQLAYGFTGDAMDEYLRMGKTTARVSLKQYCEAIVKNFGDEYIRNPTTEELTKILHQNEMRGFPGMIGSIDCMHWQWKNCPSGWKGQYSGRNKYPTLILEVVAGQDLWIWHSFFGIPGSCNDLNVLCRSPVFDEVLRGTAPSVNFTVNGNNYAMGYYLANGIYPNWATFMQGITHPQTEQQRVFSARQGAARKDVERAFGVLQARFAIIREPSRAHDEDMLADIMKTCIILHNMIVEDERDTYLQAEDLRKFYEEDVCHARKSS